MFIVNLYLLNTFKKNDFEKIIRLAVKHRNFQL